MAEDGFRIAKAFVEIEPDDEGFKEKLQAMVDDATAGVRGQVKIGADTGELDAAVDDAKAKVEDLDGKRAEPKLSADIEELRAAFDDADAKLAEFDDKRAEATIDADTLPLDEKVGEATAELDRLDEKKAEPTVDADTTPFDAKLAEVEAQLDALNEQTAGPKVSAEGGGMFGMIAGGLAGIMPGLGGAAMGLGMLGGAAALGLGGVVKAVSAAHQSSLNVGITSQQVAAQQFSNQVAIQQAQIGIAQAGMQQSMDAVTSALAVAQATQQVTQSEQSLRDAQFSEQQAQVGLTEARIQARLTLQQLQDQEMSTALGVKQAQLALQQAIYQQTLTDQNAMSTSLDRQQASLNVQQAEQQVTFATQAHSNATMEASKQNIQYFDGSQQVIQAQHSLSDAQYQVRASTLAVAMAKRALQVADQQAAFTQTRDAMAVAQAQLNLSNTIKSQQLQWAAMRASSNQAALQFAKDMARMTPAGRQMVNLILGMRGAFRGLTGAIQGALAPGMDVWLRGVKSLMPTVTTGFRQMGTAISNSFAGFGKMMQTAGFRTVLEGLIRNGIQFANTVLPAFARFIQELARIGSAKGAVSGLANLLAGLGNGLTGLAASIGRYTRFFNELLTVIGKVLAAAGPSLGTLLGTVLKVLSPLLSFLNSNSGKPFVKLLGDIVAGFIAWKIAQATIGKPAAALFNFLHSSLAKSAADFALWVAEHAAATVAYIAQNAAAAASATAAFIAENAATLGIGAAIALLVTGIVLLATHWTQAWTDIKHWAEDAWNFLTHGWGQYLFPEFTAIRVAVQFLADHWAAIWNTIKVSAELVWDGIKVSAQEFVRGISVIWHGLEDVFKAPVNFLIGTVYDKGIATLWNDVVSHIGLSSIKLPVIPQLAGGGMVPGHDTGVDSQLVAMRPGEGVLTPQAVSSIGGPNTIHALNQSAGSSSQQHGAGTMLAKTMLKLPIHEARRRTVDRPAEHMVGLAGGGVLGSIGNVISSAGHAIGSAVSGALDVGKMITALATGNPAALGNALGKFVRTPAKGDLARIMTSLPMTLIHDAVQAVTSMFSTSGLPGGSSGAVGLLPANWKAIATYLSSHGFSKYAAAGVAGNIFAESGGDPEILEIGGGGGGGLIQWTPYPRNYITGNYMGDLYTQLGAILRWGGGPGLVNRGTSPSNAAQIYQDYYERPASLTASIGTRMASANAVYQAMGWGKFDSGGWMVPGMPGLNTSGQPEAVLTPDQSQALITLARSIAQHPGAGGGQVVVNQNWFGPQMPSQEQMASMRRDMALALGG